MLGGQFLKYHSYLQVTMSPSLGYTPCEDRNVCLICVPLHTEHISAWHKEDAHSGFVKFEYMPSLSIS